MSIAGTIWAKPARPSNARQPTLAQMMLTPCKTALNDTSCPTQRLSWRYLGRLRTALPAAARRHVLHHHVAVGARLSHVGRTPGSPASGVHPRTAPLVRCIQLFCGVAISCTCAATHCDVSFIPIARKHFQLPSGSFFNTISTVPRICFASPPGESAYEAVN